MTGEGLGLRGGRGGGGVDGSLLWRAIGFILFNHDHICNMQGKCSDRNIEVI